MDITTLMMMMMLPNLLGSVTEIGGMCGLGGSAHPAAEPAQQVIQMAQPQTVIQVAPTEVVVGGSTGAPSLAAAPGSVTLTPEKLATVNALAQQKQRADQQEVRMAEYFQSQMVEGNVGAWSRSNLAANAALPRFDGKPIEGSEWDIAGYTFDYMAAGQAAEGNLGVKGAELFTSYWSAHFDESYHPAAARMAAGYGNYQKLAMIELGYV